MTRAKIFSIVLLAIMIMATFAVAQDPAQKSSTPKSEVDQAVEESEQRGEKVLTSCLKDCQAVEQPAVSGFERPRPVMLAKPGYPPIAAAAHAQGEVDVRVLLDFDGKVIAAHAIAGHPLLQAASVKAARESEFTSATLDGKPVKVLGVIRYTFVQ
jgi:TonB family protein